MSPNLTYYLTFFFNLNKQKLESDFLFNSREGQNIILTSLNLLYKDKISVKKLDINENQNNSVIIPLIAFFLLAKFAFV